MVNAIPIKQDNFLRKEKLMNLIQTLKDKNYNVLGYIYDDGDKLVIKDKNYNVKGYYYKKDDVTKNQNYNVIGHGNLLTTLL